MSLLFLGVFRPAVLYDVGILQRTEIVGGSEFMQSLNNESNRLVDKVWEYLTAMSSNVELKTREPLKLDRETVKPDRDALYYDKEKGLYATRESQKGFFIALLMRFAQDKLTKDMIREYGRQMSFACIVCTNDTELVDPHLGAAFCSDLCRLVHK